MFHLSPPVVRHLPSLLAGFPGRISQLSISTMKMLRLPALFSCISFPYSSIPLPHAPVLGVSKYGMLSSLTWIVVPPVFLNRHYAKEGRGSPKFPCLPVVHLVCSPTPACSRSLTLTAVRYCSRLCNDKSSGISAISRLNSTSFELPVYASCLHFCRRCKTRLQLVVSLYCSGLVT